MINPYAPPYIFILLAAIVWSLIWKGIALWHAGRNKQKAWFILLLIFNTLGLLPIGYLLWGQKDKNKER